MQERKRVPLSSGTVINRGKSSAPNSPHTLNDSVALLGCLCPLAEVLAALGYFSAQGTLAPPNSLEHQPSWPLSSPGTSLSAAQSGSGKPKEMGRIQPP